VQIYCETISDLLAETSPQTGAPTVPNLPIRESPTGGFYVVDLSEYVISSYEDASRMINLGLENRAMAPTLMNTTSSRSHTILCMKVTSAQGDTGKLQLVDLAGSERIRRTTSSGVRLSEARSINASLSALGNVITGLAKVSVCEREGARGKGREGRLR